MADPDFTNQSKIKYTYFIWLSQERRFSVLCLRGECDLCIKNDPKSQILVAAERTAEVLLPEGAAKSLSRR